ncbi:hypothetical protein KR018_006928, partial [Drosophila ironensis]
IVNELMALGMTDIDAAQVDRKFRNLKKTYYYVKNKYTSSDGLYQPRWQFYNEMAVILRDDNGDDKTAEGGDIGRVQDEDSNGSAGASSIKRSVDAPPPSEPPPNKRKLEPEDNPYEPQIIVKCKDEISINSREDALKHLRALQEYAMFQDNFRAIGLLMQAEQAIESPPNSKDFEV